MFSRGGALSTLSIFKTKGNIKYSRLVFMDFNTKDFRGNPYQEGVFDAEQATNLKILQPVTGTRRWASLITHRSGALGEDPLRPFHDWGLK